MNLLPQEKKKYLIHELIFRFVIVVFFIVYLWSVIFLVISYNSALYLNAQMPALEERIDIERKAEKSSEAANIEEEIKELNEILQTIEKVRQKESFNFPQILRVIGSLVPNGVIMNSITFQGGTINLKGHADSRQGVLLLKENLEKEESFQNVVSPLSNIVKEKDIDFNFSFSL